MRWRVRGKADEAPLPCWQASRVHVTLDQPTLMQVDGEVLERFSEVDFTVDFHALTVCIPP